MRSFKDVCNYLIFVSLSNEIEINTIKLSKFVYLCNILSIALTGQRLTIEPLVRLKHSPGVKQVFDYYSITEQLKFNPVYKKLEDFTGMFTSVEAEIMNKVVFDFKDYTAFRLTELLIDSLNDRNFHDAETYSLIEAKYLDNAASSIFPEVYYSRNPKQETIGVYEEKGLSIKCNHYIQNKTFNLDVSKEGKTVITTSFTEEQDAMESFRSAVCQIVTSISVTSALDKIEKDTKSRNRNRLGIVLNP